jgi:maleylacetate reductase
MTDSGTLHFMAIERVIFGRPCAEALREEAERLGAERVFLLVSKSLATGTDEIAKVRGALGRRCVGEFSGIPPHTPRDVAVQAAAEAREAGADLLITIGGGSVTDTGKMVQLCLQHDITEIGQLDAFKMTVALDGTRHRPQYTGPEVRQISVPTTLSGGEFNQSAGCTDPRGKVKEAFSHRLLAPRVLVLDPAVTLHTPQWLWLSSGIRAVDHAVETICAPDANPYCDGEAAQALRLLREGLLGCKENPGDLDARLNCQLGVQLSMTHNKAAITMGASHGIGHVLGGTCDVPHGHTSCVMLPHVLRYNLPVNAHRQALVSTAMGRPGDDAADVIGEFIASLGLPRTLAEVGVHPDQFELIAHNAMHDRGIHANPRPIRGPEDVMDILEMAA